MDKYDKKDAAEDTDSSTKDVSRAWHDARDDAAEEGGWGVPADRHGEGDSSGESDSGSADSDE